MKRLTLAATELLAVALLIVSPQSALAEAPWEKSLKTAIAVWEQEDAKRRSEAADADKARSDKDFARVNKELTTVNEQIALLDRGFLLRCLAFGPATCNE